LIALAQYLVSYWSTPTAALEPPIGQEATRKRRFQHTSGMNQTGQVGNLLGKVLLRHPDELRMTDVWLFSAASLMSDEDVCAVHLGQGLSAPRPRVIAFDQVYVISRSERS
jgi:hypothetical protein